MNEYKEIMNNLIIKKMNLEFETNEEFNKYLIKKSYLLSNIEYRTYYKQWHPADLQKDINQSYIKYKKDFIINKIKELNKGLYNKYNHCILYINYYKYYVYTIDQYDSCSELLDNSMIYYIEYESMYNNKVKKEDEYELFLSYGDLLSLLIFLITIFIGIYYTFYILI